MVEKSVLPGLRSSRDRSEGELEDRGYRTMRGSLPQPANSEALPTTALLLEAASHMRKT